jgi:hypothetical protein
MISRLLRKIQRWQSGESMREKLGGTWFLIEENSTSWGAKYWTRIEPDPMDYWSEVIEIVNYENKEQGA